MKEKNIKFILELIFIFILPLCLLATCFEQEKVYDENNNEVGKYLTFDNIFILSEEQITYYNYEYYDLNESISLTPDDSIYVNYNISPYIYFYLSYSQQYYTRLLVVGYDSQNVYNIDVEERVINSTSVFDLSFSDYGVTIIRNSTPFEIINKYGNLVKNINSYTIGNNVINRLLNNLYDSLGITNNWILQFITIYTLLWLIMWFIWHILYLPLDFICSKLLFDRVDK